jgi:hypothetical protein
MKWEVNNKRVIVLDAEVEREAQAAQQCWRVKTSSSSRGHSEGELDIVVL